MRETFHETLARLTRYAENQPKWKHGALKSLFVTSGKPRGLVTTTRAVKE